MNNKSIIDVVDFGCLSDRQRWDAENYKWDWLDELGENDRKIIELLDCIADGEFSGQASAVQLYELLFDEVKSDFYPEGLRNDWGEILSYVNIIVYEEMRHGLVLSTLHHYATTNEKYYIDKISIREYTEKYIWCYEERRYWDLYSYTLSHLFGEIVNTELYRDIKDKITHPKLKVLVTNIMKDEARHTKAWLAIIKNLVSANDYHKKRALKTIDVAITFHNAMVHETFFEGQNKVMELFSKSKIDVKGSIDRILDRKFNTLNELFQDQNPYTKADLLKSHMDFLSKSMGKDRARFSGDTNNKIEFIS